MRKILLILLIIAAFLAIDVQIAHLMEPVARSPSEAVEKASVDVLAQVLAQVMKWRLKLPQKVDETTTFENINAERSMMIYSMATSVDGNEFDRMMSDIHNHLDETSCTREDYRKLLAYGLSIAIGFRSPSGKEAVPVIITPQMCGAK